MNNIFTFQIFHPMNLSEENIFIPWFFFGRFEEMEEVRYEEMGRRGV
jgi:hypothetical protein